MKCQVCGKFFDGHHKNYRIVKKGNRKLQACHDCGKLSNAEIASIPEPIIDKKGNLWHDFARKGRG